jgi:hypothetical protein
MVALILGACEPDGPRGYAIWVTNESASDHLVSMGGESSLGDTPDPSSVTFLSPRRSAELMGPFVDLDRAADGSLLPAQVRVLAVDCRIVSTFEVGAGDYHLVIDASGSGHLEEYGWGQRPTSQDYLAETRQCVDH